MPQCVRCRGARLVESQHLRIDATKTTHIVFDQSPFGFQASLWPRRIRSVLVVVFSNPLPENSSSLLVAHDSILRHKQHGYAQMLFFRAVEILPLHARLCRPSFIRHPRACLFPPPRHYENAGYRQKVLARTLQRQRPGVCSEKQAPSPCREGPGKCRGRAALYRYRWYSGEVTGCCAREGAVEATVGDNGGHALRTSKEKY